MKSLLFVAVIGALFYSIVKFSNHKQFELSRIPEVSNHPGSHEGFPADE